MAKITLITGGVRSGKSSYALSLAGKYKGKKVFIATAVAIDKEMAQRIRDHRRSRGRRFVTVEEPFELGKAIKKPVKPVSVLVVDCLTVWLGNLFYKYDGDEKRVVEMVRSFIKELKTATTNCIIVTNETGWGIVPENELSRKFRDVAGYANQAAARISDTVYLMCSGIPVKIKG